MIRVLMPTYSDESLPTATLSTVGLTCKI